MKKYHLIQVLSVAIIASFMLAAGLFVHAEAIKDPNPYNNTDKSLEGVMSEYHKHMNDTFNKYIKTMLTAQEANASDPNGNPLDSAADCYRNEQNYSTFCLAANLLGGNSALCAGKDKATDDFKAFCSLGSDALAVKGYLNYKAALEKRRNDIFDSAEESGAYDAYIEAMTIGKEKEDEVKAISHTETALKISARLEATNVEIDAAKETLDQTLSAYDQLRAAWPMHKQYMGLFKDLQTYRDKIIEIRHQTDTFPSKFIDVTTTKCT